MYDQKLTNTKRWLKNRRSERIYLNVPVVVYRPPKEGPQFYESTQTLVVNAHGALMALAEKVAPKQRLLLQRAQDEKDQIFTERAFSFPSEFNVHIEQTEK